MAGKQLQAGEKKVLKITRDGAVEHNLVQDTGSKLQADYDTHREETPLKFENTAPAPASPS